MIIIKLSNKFFFLYYLPFVSMSFFIQFSKVKPFIIRGPYDQTVVEGSSVTFQCRVGGEPIPDILCKWPNYIHLSTTFIYLYLFIHFQSVFISEGVARLPLATCHWVCIKFISKLYTLIKSNQFISESVGLGLCWLEFSMDCIFIAVLNSSTNKIQTTTTTNYYLKW